MAYGVIVSGLGTITRFVYKHDFDWGTVKRHKGDASGCKAVFGAGNAYEWASAHTAYFVSQAYDGQWGTVVDGKIYMPTEKRPR